MNPLYLLGLFVLLWPVFGLLLSFMRDLHHANACIVYGLLEFIACAVFFICFSDTADGHYSPGAGGILLLISAILVFLLAIASRFKYKQAGK